VPSCFGGLKKLRMNCKDVVVLYALIVLLCVCSHLNSGIMKASFRNEDMLL
jgi:hypothetical protein